MAGTSGERQTATLIVKFKSANASEFVAQHGRSVSRGGIFLKAAKPPRLGLRLRFEIRARDDTPILAGRGRVVWQRAAGAEGSLPAGVGIAFEALDDASKALVDRIVRERTTAPSLFDEDALAEHYKPSSAPKAAVAAAALPAAPAPAPTPAQAAPAPPAVAPAAVPAPAPAPVATRVSIASTVAVAAPAPRIEPLRAVAVQGTTSVPDEEATSPTDEAQGFGEPAPAETPEPPVFEDIEVEEAEEAMVSVPPGAPEDDEEEDPTIPLVLERPAPRGPVVAPAPAAAARVREAPRSRPPARVARSLAIVVGLAALAGAGFFAWQGMLARERAAMPQEVRVAPAAPPPAPAEVTALAPSPPLAGDAASDGATPDGGMPADAAATQDAALAELAGPGAAASPGTAAPATVAGAAPSAIETAAETKPPTKARKRKARRRPAPTAATASGQPQKREGGLAAAQACLAEGDNACAIRALEGNARTPRELALLIETYRATGDAEKARAAMKTFVERYPDDRSSDRFRRTLEP